MMGTTFSTPDYNEFYKTRDLGIFERVIDNVILDRYSNDEELKGFIKNLPVEDKRMSTLSLVIDDNVLWHRIYKIHRSNDTKYNKIKQIILLLRDYVKIADVSAKSHGEILTPFKELAKPMVNLIDKYDDDFWKNPNHKVLDSSAGYGTFLILCLYKFMEGLVNEIEDEDERLKHIIENQLYYGELQSKSVFSWLVAIDPNDEYNTNIYWGSYLEDGFDYHMKNVWNIDKFDLIIQNPPYQMQRDGFKKTQPLWHLFVQKSLKLLKEDKYMIMVHPAGWRSPEGIFREVFEEFQKRKIYHLSLNDFKKGAEIFGVGTNYDYYLLKNSEKDVNHLTTVETSDGIITTLNINSLSFIPNGDFEMYQNLSNGDIKVNIIHSFSSYETRKSWVSKDQKNDFIYPCIYTITQKSGITNFFSNRNDNGHFGIPKVIWTNGLGTYPVIDQTGYYGLTQFAYGITDDIENLENIKKAMESERFIKMMEYSKFTNNKYDYKIIRTFRKDFWKEFI